MTDIRDITLGDRTFAVPALPLRINRVVYPICRKLVEAELIERCISADGALACTDEELDGLIRIALLSAQAADAEFTQEAFDAMPVTPPQLLDAFFIIRYQTGAWVPSSPGKPDSDGAEAEGEAEGV